MATVIPKDPSTQITNISLMDSEKHSSWGITSGSYFQVKNIWNEKYAWGSTSPVPNGMISSSSTDNRAPSWNEVLLERLDQTGAKKLLPSVRDKNIVMRDGEWVVKDSQWIAKLFFISHKAWV